MNASRAGQRAIEDDKDGNTPAIVKSRADVLPYHQGTIYTDLLPVRRSLVVLLAWVVACYAAAWHGLRQKQPL